MNSMMYLLLLIIVGFCHSIDAQCSGGQWPIQDASIGTFTVSWRYNLASNTVQFVIEGQASASVNLASTYIAVGWSDTAPTMSNMDLAMFFPGTQTVQDRYSRGYAPPSLDDQQDFCVFRMNISNQNTYVAFERFVTTGDANDISFMPSVYLMFAMGSYTFAASTNTFNPQRHFFRLPFQTRVNLINCTSVGCLTKTCTTASCPCLQQINVDASQCLCFPPSSCVSGSTITPRTTAPVLTTTSLPSTLSTVNNGGCQSSINPCSPNGVCLPTSSSQFVCQCRSDFTGTLCQTPLVVATMMTTTSPCLCTNGGICQVNGTCACSNLFRGRLCQLANPCTNYCRNNGVCSVTCTDTACGTPVCVCPVGFIGLQCDTMATGPCQSNPCSNGNCTVTTNGGFQCQCSSGFSGPRCDLINGCLSSPCNQGSCVASTNCVGSICGYSCLCPNGTTGANCEIGGNACWNNPCKNGAACTSLANTYLCQCASGYGGSNCDLLINVCTPNPCWNNGICVVSLNSQDGPYRCICPTASFGARCEYANGCVSSPCRNGGQCLPSTNNCSSTVCPSTCRCPAGFTGALCEQVDSSCLSLPCLNGGVCLVNPATNISSCQCPSNTIGARCNSIPLTCLNTTCSNNGVCYIDGSSGTNTVRCLCFQDYTGLYCQSSLVSNWSCLSNPCGSNGTCISQSTSSYICRCPNGLTGQSCNSIPSVPCSASPCHYLSICQPLSNVNSSGYQCLCPDYLIGDRCQYTNNCQRQPCFNQGTCIPLGPQNNFMCSCQPGFGHFDCSIYLGLVCTASVCLNGGTCQSNGTNIRCLCPSGFVGARCEWTSVCSTTTCLNGGSCRQTAATMAECLCAIGFTGPTCALRDSCANFPCKNGAACTTLLTDAGTNWSSYRCTCSPGTFGQNCDQPIRSCSTLACQSPRICSEQGTGPVCTCPGNKAGTFCQYDDPCSLSSSPVCANGGTCVSSNTDPPIATCLCRDRFTGPQCATSATNQNDICSSNPCDARGYCALSNSNTSFACVCQTSFVGDRCERTNPCLSAPCMNQAVCSPNWNATSTWFTCRCVGTFTGTRCETSLVNPCAGLCMNGSPCVSGVCICPAQFTGAFCGFVNPCSTAICRNGGLCSPVFNASSASFTCTCRSSFTGQFCETPLFALALSVCSSTCPNNGSCVNGACVCTSQNIGPLCQYTNPCSTRNPCLNSGTCFGRSNLNGTLYTQCFCLQGYTGDYCESTLCSLTSCNGGVCTAAQNTIVCACPSGKVGDRCQFADACATNPCLPTERCDQTGSQYQCTSCYDQSTFCSVYQTLTVYCDNRYTLLVNNTFVPVLQACQRSCGQCTSGQRSNNTRALLGMINADGAWLEENYTSIAVTKATSTSQAMPGQELILLRSRKCEDRRDDCALQKTYGFCDIFNEKYPLACTNTCHPDCASHP